MINIPAVIRCSQCGNELHHNATKIRFSIEQDSFLQPISPIVFRADPCSICLDIARTENPKTMDGKKLFNPEMIRTALASECRCAICVAARSVASLWDEKKIEGSEESHV